MCKAPTRIWPKDNGSAAESRTGIRKKKLLLLAAVSLLVLLLAGCRSIGETKTLHCDRCGREVQVRADSKMDDENWILYCTDCEKALGLDHIVPED